MGDDAVTAVVGGHRRDHRVADVGELLDLVFDLGEVDGLAVDLHLAVECDRGARAVPSGRKPTAITGAHRAHAVVTDEEPLGGERGLVPVPERHAVRGDPDLAGSPSGTGPPSSSTMSIRTPGHGSPDRHGLAHHGRRGRRRARTPGPPVSVIPYALSRRAFGKARRRGAKCVGRADLAAVDDESQRVIGRPSSSAARAISRRPSSGSGP